MASTIQMVFWEDIKNKQTVEPLFPFTNESKALNCITSHAAWHLAKLGLNIDHVHTNWYSGARVYAVWDKKDPNLTASNPDKPILYYTIRKFRVR